MIDMIPPVFMLFLIILTSCTKTDEKSETLQSPEKRSEKISLTESHAEKLVKISLSCVNKHYPYKPGHTHMNKDDAKPHTSKTPVFSGCFDWHSAVHGHWTMTVILKKYPEMKKAGEIRKILNTQFTVEKMKKEEEFFNTELNQNFERPYGWAWYLRLYSEVYSFDDSDAVKWEKVLRPLAKTLAEKTGHFLNKLSVPVRNGTHTNTAFALNHIFDYAETVNDEKLKGIIKKRSVDFYMSDRNCPVEYEPSGFDFISPCLAEADLMRKVLPEKKFLKWIEKFLPSPETESFKSIRNPPAIHDPEDYHMGHLIGLMFHRSWTLQNIASSFPDKDPRKFLYEEIANSHKKSGLTLMDEAGYGGSHWLASFAVFMFTRQ